MSLKSPMLKALLILTTILTLSACNSSDSISQLKFSFNTEVASNSTDEKIIYINNDMDKLQLSAELKMDSGDVTIQVIKNSTGELVWNESYKESSSFIIELPDLKKESEYTIKIEAEQAKNVTLEITSEHKLVQDKEKHEIYRLAP